MLWETKSGEIKTYKCSFHRYEYDPAFLDPKYFGETPSNVSTGEVSYRRPDKGCFQITESEVQYVNPKTKELEKKSVEPYEHWVCTGKEVYEYDAPNKQLKVYDVPPEMRGKAIVDGPLPFLFGAEAEKLRRRYFIRIFHETDEEIWLDVYPRRQEDAASYSRVEIVLDREKFLPKALQVYAPNAPTVQRNVGQRTVYIMGDATVNSVFDQVMMFQKPIKPLTWKLVRETPPPAER